MSFIALYYYYVFPSHNTQDFWRTYWTENEVKSIFLNTNTLSLITMKNKANNFNCGMIIGYHGEVFYDDCQND